MITTIIWTLVFLAAIGFFKWQLWGRFQILRFARKDDGRDYSSKTWAKRTKDLLVYGIGQRKFFRGEQPVGIMHVLIFWGFLVLSLQVISMFLRGWFPDFYIPGLAHGPLALAYSFLKDTFEVLVLIGISIAFTRWLITKPTRLYGFLPAEKKLRGQSHGEAFLILTFISLIMLSGLFYDAGRIFLTWGDLEMESERQGAWLASSLAHLFSSREQAELVVGASWWLHNGVILAFLNLLPRSKHFHIITSLPNVFLGKMEARGRLPKKDYAGENPLFGRSQVDQFTWKQVLDMYSCTECGRCSSVCPATATAKPLAPRQFLLNLRDAVYANQTNWIQKRAVNESPTFDVVVGDDKPVIDEVVWSCVQCRACEEACPVNIEYVDKIVDLRQHLVQEASRFPGELSRAFRGLETNSNPWGISSEERFNWADGMEVPLITDNPTPEYLYYVGCGGSFDSENRKVTQSFVKILKKAGVSFAVLGKQELCNGETARRLGNEYLYQTMAEALVGVLNAHNVKKILVNCPHCFNTLKNEYPDFGGHYEVIRAGDLVSKLVAEGKVPMQANRNGKTVVYHDSCNYGRFNGVYDEPRQLLQHAGAKLAEVEKSRENGTCCGAGGGRMWMEEPKDQRVNIMRTDQLLEKKPDVIATSCPFCKIMVGSAVNEKGIADKVQVMDVMELVSSQLT